MGLHECSECGLKFGLLSNLTRHKKGVHPPKQFMCKCGKEFSLKQGLDRHSKCHAYPKIPLFKPSGGGPAEAMLKYTKEGNASSTPFPPIAVPSSPFR